jgi:hypothetical protein
MSVEVENTNRRIRARDDAGEKAAERRHEEVTRLLASILAVLYEIGEALAPERFEDEPAESESAPSSDRRVEHRT